MLPAAVVDKSYTTSNGNNVGKGHRVLHPAKCQTKDSKTGNIMVHGIRYYYMTLVSIPLLPQLVTIVIMVICFTILSLVVSLYRYEGVCVKYE